MPPTTRGAHNLPFIALWVEDGLAKLWRVDPAGPIDEIARFAIEGMARATVLEISAQFVKAAGPRRNIIDDLTLSPSTPTSAPANGGIVATPYQGMGRPRKTDVPPKKRAGKKSRGYTPRAQQIARQAELAEALRRHGGEGVTSQTLAEELGRGGSANVGVSLGVLERAGHAIRVDGKWYAVENGTIPPAAP